MMLSVIVGSTLYSIAQMVQWISTRPDLLPKVILRPMAWIILRHFLQLLGWTPSGFYSLVVNLSWTLFQLDVKNAFLYGDLQEVYKKQPPGMLLRERINYVVSGSQYMNSSRVYEHGLRSLASTSLALVFIIVTQITLSLFGVPSLAS